MKFHLISLGCPKNTADSESVAANLERHGLAWTFQPEEADILLVNTCGFIEDAKKESLQTIMRLLKIKENNPNVSVVVFGCMVKRYQSELAKEIPEIDVLFEFFSGCELDRLIAHKVGTHAPETSLACFHQPRKFTPSHIGFLKIAEGCSNRCAYCAIPDIRGPFRSRPFEEVLKDAEMLVKTGAKEINVVAQDTTRFGTDEGGPCQLSELVKQLAEFTEIRWIRLHYLHPARLTPQLLDSLFNSPKVMPYFDIPFQHVSDRLLTLMNRKTDKKSITSLLEHIRRNYKEAVIRSTFIVGFPSETESEFEELIDFIQEHPIDRLGAFPYSPEEGTPAFKMKHKISNREKNRRLDELMTLQQLLAAEQNQKLVGTIQSIMIDTVDRQKVCGRLKGDAWEIDNTVNLPASIDIIPGDIINVRILSADAYDFKAEAIR